MCKDAVADCFPAVCSNCEDGYCAIEGCDICPQADGKVVPFVGGGAINETATFRDVEVPVTDPEEAVAPGWPTGFAARFIREDGTLLWRTPFGDDTFQATFADLFQETFDLLVERQRKYGPENISTQGFYGVFTRMASDKIERLRRSLNGKVVEGRVELDAFVDSSDETVEDALLDIANYALIMLALKRGLWGRPLEPEA
jgi:hypothetical protein